MDTISYNAIGVDRAKYILYNYGFMAINNYCRKELFSYSMICEKGARYLAGRLCLFCCDLHCHIVYNKLTIHGS